MRVPDWSQRLNRYINEVQARYKAEGLVWGRIDCCIFAADWVRECTGQDLMADYRGRYDSRESAAALLRENGPGSLYHACIKALGTPRPGVFGRRGDIAYRKAERSVGIFLTQGTRSFAVFLGEDGFTSLPAKSVDLAFRVD